MKWKIWRLFRRPFYWIVAKNVLRETIRRKGENTLVIFSMPMIGDTVYTMAFLDALHAKFPEKKICVVSNAKSKDLLESYTAIDQIVLCQSKREAFRISAFMKCGSVSEKGLPYGIYNGYIYHSKACQKSENPEMLYQLRTNVFQVGQDAPLTFHQMRYDQPVTAIDNFEQQHDRIVILNPYSNSIEADQELFGQLSDHLKRKGYIVYTNVIDSQPVIRGTKELRCSLPELYGIAGRIPMMISIRSGILDFLVPSGVRMLVLYQNCSKYFKRVYSMSGWGEGRRIKEVFSHQGKFSLEEILRQLDVFLNEVSTASCDNGGRT